MGRRCIVCGEKPIGDYIIPTTIVEARRWLNLANLNSSNLDVATYRKWACVCVSHLKGFNDELCQKTQSVTENTRRCTYDQRRWSENLGTNPNSPRPSPSASCASEMANQEVMSFSHLEGFKHELCQRKRSGSENTRRCRDDQGRCSKNRGTNPKRPYPVPFYPSGMMNQQGIGGQKFASYSQTQCLRSTCPVLNNQGGNQMGRGSELVSPEYQSMGRQAGATESCMSQSIPCPQRCPTCSACAQCKQREMMESNARDQCQQMTRLPPLQKCTQQQQQEQDTAESIYLNLNNTLGQQRGMLSQQQPQQKSAKQQMPQRQQKRKNRSNSRSGPGSNMQSKKAMGQCCPACNMMDQGVQYASQMVQPPAPQPNCSNRPPPTGGCRAKIPFSIASTNSIVYPTKGPSAKASKVDMSLIIQGMQSGQEQEKPCPGKTCPGKTCSGKNKPNIVNVLLMAGSPKESCDASEYICPETFQPSPLSEIRLLQSDLTDANERAAFQDLDHPNYRVCRASTNDSEGNCQGEEQDENCADVLVLDQGPSCSKCPPICICGMTNENGNNCGQWKSETLSQLPEGANWFDTAATSNSTKVLELQAARIKELYCLLAEQSELQKTIQAKMAELQQGPSDSGNSAAADPAAPDPAAPDPKEDKSVQTMATRKSTK
ncbi:uncharacterized protein [Drosophila pseudoobscura]|uniref:THAP-type domain-containing protein n=1 Tax=Drosophila pseudoobscura pseudoobscura TaxID=46245 RepID=A0A6I8URT8_DROPS|nr:uncharacterized protein LOC4803098 [Drosophila pseudoobscura]